MSLQTWQETLISSSIDGATLTAAAAATMLPAAAKVTLPPSFFQVGKVLRIRASGRISCVVTTPGTARYDVRFTDSAATAVTVFDGLAMNLNTTAKTNVGWQLEIMLTCRAIGTSANLMGQGWWVSEAGIGAAAVTAGTNAMFNIPYNSAPAVGSNFNSTLSNQVDMFFTQTVATGSMTCHMYELTALN